MQRAKSRRLVNVLSPESRICANVNKLIRLSEVNNMKMKTYPRIDWVKWTHWDPIKTRPILFVEMDNGDFLCVPGTSLTKDVDFSLQILDKRWNLSNTNFNWHEAKRCCSLCHTTSLESYHVSDIPPIDNEIPIVSEFICNCELAIYTTDGSFLTFKMSKPSRLAIELGWEDEQNIFQFRNKSYLVDWDSIQVNCTICQKNSRSLVNIKETSLNKVNKNLKNLQTKNVVCECDFTRFEIIKNNDSNHICIVYYAYNQGGFEVVYLDEKGIGTKIKPTKENNLTKPYHLGEIGFIDSGFNWSRIGHLDTRENIGMLGYYISGGDFKKLPW